MSAYNSKDMLNIEGLSHQISYMLRLKIILKGNVYDTLRYNFYQQSQGYL